MHSGQACAVECVHVYREAEVVRGCLYLLNCVCVCVFVCKCVQVYKKHCQQQLCVGVCTCTVEFVQGYNSNADSITMNV